MITSYVALATRDGLVAFRPEHGRAVRELTTAAYGSASLPRGVCCWATLAAEDAEAVRSELDAGDSAQALVVLNRCATQIGTILPSDLRPRP